MELFELIRDLGVESRTSIPPGIDVSDLHYDSRRIGPGDLFVTWRGEKTDGRRHAPAAVAAGAVAVLADDRPLEPLPPPPVPWLEAADPRALLGPLASRLFDHPDRELLTVGVTGTNGKTTVTWLLAAVLEGCGRPTAVFGTLGYRFRDLAFAGERTTPEGSDLFRLLRQVREAGAEAVAMEVSSHALAQRRVEGIGYDVAVFTNLSREHFDFHGDFESYYAAKRRLFDHLREGGRAVVNLDDRWGRRLAAELDGVVGFGEGGAVRIVELELGEAGLRATLATPRGPLEIESQLIGRYNLENLLAVVAVAELLELDRAEVRAAVAAQRPIAGRLEPVRAGQAFPVLIDYAHTESALEAALRSLRELGDRKLAVVFGCGGDRDPGKRAGMGRIAGELADLPILTNDNPRSEDPLHILGQIEAGVRESGNRKYKVIPDRREAIRRAVAIAAARQDWCVLIAGKGHEEVQVVGDETRPFSDRDEARAALEESLGSAANR